MPAIRDIAMISGLLKRNLIMMHKLRRIVATALIGMSQLSLLLLQGLIVLLDSMLHRVSFLLGIVWRRKLIVIIW